MSDLERLQTERQMYVNAIMDLEGKLADLKTAKRSLEMKIHAIERDMVPVTRVPYRGPRAPRKELVTCHTCDEKTRLRIVSNGLEVAECKTCQMDTVLAKAVTEASDLSAPEQTDGRSDT